MPGNKRHDDLDAMLDRALAAYANCDPPSGMEERILAKLARKKAKSQRRMRVACLALTAALLGAAILGPLDSARPGFQSVDQAMEPSTEAAERLESSPLALAAFPPVTKPDDRPAEIATLPVLHAIDESVEEESLISDFEVEPLTIAALDFPALASR